MLFGDVLRTADRAPRLFLSFSYRCIHETLHQLQACRVAQTVEIEVERHVSKLGKLLRSYSPDLVQLHGAFQRLRARTRIPAP